SKVLPVDRHVSENSFHLGPQIREFVPVLAEGDADVAICPLTNEARTILNEKLAANPNLLLEIHQKYYEFGYPIANPLRVIASASEHIHKELATLKTLRETLFPGIHEKKDQVFCSELVALIYSQFGGGDGAFATFTSAPADTFSPLELEVASEFGGAVYYAKLDKIVWFKDGLINVDPHVTRAQKLLQAQKYHKNWKPVDAETAAAEAAGLAGVPENAVEVGVDTDGKKVYVARVKIGSAFRIGKIREGEATPLVGYFGREVRIKYGHEVLYSLEDAEWVEAENGSIPENAIEAGLEEDGTPFYVARALAHESHGFLGFHHHGIYVPGGIAHNLGSARIPFAGVEVNATKYQ
ncbi:hypothetical protein HK100_010201, partial [Physocladia obscura]